MNQEVEMLRHTPSRSFLSTIFFLGLLCIASNSTVRAMDTASATEPRAGRSVSGSLYDFTVNDIDDKPVSLEKWRGKVLLIVNVASKCGFTGQYAGLQKLYETYRERGFEVLGFPANDFLWQEPGTNSEIKSFCTLQYKVTFPMFSKISVKGNDQHPLYTFLTNQTLHKATVGAISWNFNKFLIDRSGQILVHFGAKTDPLSPEMIQAVETALASSTVAPGNIPTR